MKKGRKSSSHTRHCSSPEIQIMKKMSLALIATALLFLCPIRLSHAAAVLATGGVYGGPSQKYVYCYVFNAGSKTLTFSTDRYYGILNQSGQAVSPWTATSIAPNKTLAIGASIANNTTYACRIGLVQAKTNARGTLDIRDVNQNVLVNSPLR
jgi:hypothetical protein